MVGLVQSSTAARGAARRRGAQSRTMIIAVAVALVAAACGGAGGSGKPKAPDDAAAADPAGVLRVGLDIATSGGLMLDPAKMAAGQYVYSTPVLATLLERNKDATFSPG